MKFLVAFALVLFTQIGCKKDNQNQSINLSDCMKSEISTVLSQPKGGSFYKIDAFEYNDKVVFLYHEGCCDKYNNLKDEKCIYLFSPSGGITGCGDCTNPNFITAAKFLKTLWVDPRP